MTLISRVTAALDSGVDADVFERCAVALMSNVYDNVAPIEGGSDGGRDADIYGPIANDPDSRGRILVTTGDMLDNLKSSYATWEKIWGAGEPFRVDQLVMVTHAITSDAKRRNILKYCEEKGLPVPQFWTREWLVEALRKDRDWRVALTGVHGRLEAVTAHVPAADQVQLIGRSEEVAELQVALEMSGDTILVGLPGVGKSRLLLELTGEFHVVEPRAREHLTEDLVAVNPSVVVLDDAHLHPGVLEELLRIRIVERLRFEVVVVCWPGAEVALESTLTSPTRVELGRLARPELDELVHQLGVHGVRARQLILDQADGRPGWASVLSKLVVDGSGETLTSGQYLLDKVMGLTWSIAGTAALNDALAWISALQPATLEDLEKVAARTSVPYADLVTWLESTARGGIVARAGDAWTVFPALRPMLVAAWFFGARKVRSWGSISTAFASDPRLDQTLLQIAALVPDREALDLADEWFSKIESAETLDVPVLRMVALYGQLTESAADRATDFAQSALAEPRGVTQDAFGRTHDAVGTGAVEVVTASFRRTCSRQSTRALLDLTTNDDRSRHNNPNHPQRVIQEMVRYLDPDVGPLRGLRERVLTYALEWFDDAPSGQRWEVLAEVCCSVFDPHLEGAWLDPGSRRKFTVANGLETPEAMAELIVLWDKLDSRVRDPDEAILTRSAVSHLCEVSRIWSTLSASGNGEVGDSEEHRVVARDGAGRVLATLVHLVDRFPALPIRINKQLDLLAHWGHGEPGYEYLPVSDHRIARFAGSSEPHGDVEGWLAQRREAVTSLAEELAGLEPADALAEIQRLRAECELLDAPPGEGELAGLLATHVADPQTWLRVAVDDGVQSVVGPILTRARADGLGVGDSVSDALADPDLRGSVLRVFLHESNDLDELSQTVLNALHAGDAVFAAEIWTVDAVTPMLRALLVHPVPEIGGCAAVAFGEGAKYGPALPGELRPDWRKALLCVNPEKLPQHSRWRFEQLLAHAVANDPDLCADWFITNAESLRRPHRFRSSSPPLSQVLRELPAEQKRRICTALTRDTLRESGFAGDLLAMSDGVAADLLAQGVVDVDVLLDAMSGHRDHTIEALAPILAAAGVAPEAIAARALSARFTSGSVAGSIRRDLQFFVDLGERRPELRGVCDVADSYLQAELAKAQSAERMEHLQGW